MSNGRSHLEFLDPSFILEPFKTREREHPTSNDVELEDWVG